jgi:Right handed beta helix region
MLSTITVLSTGDTGPGTLRAAIEQANLDPAQDTINFAQSVTGTITLSTALPDLSTNIIIAGPGPSAMTLARSDADGTPNFRIFTVPMGVQVTISGMTITRGHVDFGGSGPSGGGILNEGMLTLTNCTLSYNSAGGVFGGNSAGGIFNGGTMTLVDCTISDNSASLGGGIYNAGTLMLSHCTISGNSVAGEFVLGLGGGIFNQGTLSLVDCTISGNGASTFFSSSGGGIFNGGTLTLNDCTLSGNSAYSVKIPASGGGISNRGRLTITDCTLSGNTADRFGGGIFNFNGGTLILTDCTLSGNTAGSGGGVDVAPGLGGLVGKVTTTMSLFANAAGSNFVVDAGASFVSLGHNLFSDAPKLSLDRTDLINTDPLLGPLADNGGPTLTQALLPGSPAIDAGIAVSGVTSDQRGITRPQGSVPDIGAFESRGFILAVVSGDDQSTLNGSAFPAALVVSVVSPFGEPVAGGLVTFTAPVTGAAADLVGTPAIIDSNGQAGVTATANLSAGSYSVTVGAAGAGTIAFSLTNEDPRVVSLKRFGFHDQPTLLVLTFSEPMDATRADNRANYRLARASPADRPAAKHDRAIPIRYARYNAASQTVTIRPIHRLPLRRTFLLTVVGTPPGGLTNTSGVFLDGAGTGQPGSDYTGIINRKSLAGEVGRK